MADARYKSQHSGAEIDAGIEKALSITVNPTMAGTEGNLTGLQVGNTKYIIPQTKLYRHVLQFHYTLNNRYTEFKGELITQSSEKVPYSGSILTLFDLWLYLKAYFGESLNSYSFTFYAEPLNTGSLTQGKVYTGISSDSWVFFYYDSSNNNYTYQTINGTTAATITVSEWVYEIK